MKTTVTILLLLIYSNIQGQYFESNITPQTNYSIYDTTNGIQNFIPSKVIVPEYNNFQAVSPSSYSIYDTTNGIQNIIPSQVIVPEYNNFQAVSPSSYSIYETTNGIIPSQVIVPNVYRGIPMF